MEKMYEILMFIAQGIGNGAQVTVKLLSHLEEPELRFRIDWPEDKHFEYRVASYEVDQANFSWVDVIIQKARKAYAEDFNG